MQLKMLIFKSASQRENTQDRPSQTDNIYQIDSLQGKSYL